MKENTRNTHLQKIINNKVTKVILCVCMCWFVFSAFVIVSWDNSTPSKAIAEYIYKDNPSWTTFFISVKEAEMFDNSNNELNYRLEFNGVTPTPGDMSGVFKLVKENNKYRVIEYDSNHG